MRSSEDCRRPYLRVFSDRHGVAVHSRSWLGCSSGAPSKTWPR